jgi:hypothetical protein
LRRSATKYRLRNISTFIQSGRHAAEATDGALIRRFEGVNL